MPYDKQIAVFEWPEGAARPDTEVCLYLLEVPPDGLTPQVGDNILVVSDDSPVRYKVVERELKWFQGSEKPVMGESTRFTKMWIWVRRLPESEQ